ncbi:hypothetical protein ACTXT7_010577 [Hymenolepis weldensis]
MNSEKESDLNAVTTPPTFPTFDPVDVATQIIDIVDRGSEDNSYDTLKSAVISSLSDSPEKRLLQQLTSQTRRSHSFLAPPHCR